MNKVTSFTSNELNIKQKPVLRTKQCGTIKTNNHLLTGELKLPQKKPKV